MKKELPKLFKGKVINSVNQTKTILKNNKEIKKTIIGRTNNSLITMDDELIDVSSITKIDLL